VLAESDRRGRASRDLLIEVRQKILAAFQIANVTVELVPPGWLVKSTSGKMARGANRSKWLTGSST
jgi:fatty-acyl-CoA synthase